MAETPEFPQTSDASPDVPSAPGTEVQATEVTAVATAGSAHSPDGAPASEVATQSAPEPPAAAAVAPQAWHAGQLPSEPPSDQAPPSPPSSEAFSSAPASAPVVEAIPFHGAPFSAETDAAAAASAPLQSVFPAAAVGEAAPAAAGATEVVSAAPHPAVETTAADSDAAGIAASLEVPALAAAEAGEGGEFDRLVGLVRSWLEQADLPTRWESLGGPLRGLGLLIAAVILLRIYSALLETLGDLPLIPRLLQLVGLIVLVRFALTRLVRSSDRRQILTLWKERWHAFRGRD